MASACNRGKPHRPSGIASQERLWGVHRALLSTQELKEGISIASISPRGSHLLELDRRGLTFCGSSSRKGPKKFWIWSKRIRSSGVDAGNENEYCDRAHDQPHGACSFRRSSSPNTREGASYVELSEGSDPDQVRPFCLSHTFP